MEQHKTNIWFQINGNANNGTFYDQTTDVTVLIYWPQLAKAELNDSKSISGLNMVTMAILMGLLLIAQRFGGISRVLSYGDIPTYIPTQNQNEY